MIGAAVVVIERLDKPSSNVSILFLFWHYRPSDFMPFWHIENTRKYAIGGEEISYRCIKTSIIIMIVPPPTDVKNARCQRSIFGIKRRHNHDQVDERKTKKRRKNDIENGVNEGKSYVPFLVHCPIYGTLKITRIVFSIGHRAAAEVLLFSGVLAVSSVL